jgi:hypothetical protein
MDEYQQIVKMVRNGNVSNERLKELLQMANEQLSNCAKASKLLSDTGPEKFTFEIYKEALRLGGGGKGSDITHREWSQLFPDHRQQLRENFLKTCKTGQQTFEKIKSLAQEELSKRGITISKGQKESKSACFIATEVYGSYNTPQVFLLKEYRDKYLMASRLGTLFIKLYFLISPHIACWLKHRNRMKYLIKIILDFFVVSFLEDQE